MAVEQPSLPLSLTGGFVGGEAVSWSIYAAADKPAPLDQAWPWVTGIGAVVGLLSGAIMYGLDRRRYNRTIR